MLDFTPSLRTPKFAFDPYDEVVINDISFRPFDSSEDGHLFVRSDKTGVVESFGNGELAHLANTGALSHKPDAFRPGGARKTLVSGDCLTAVLKDNIAERLKIRASFVHAFKEMYTAGETKRTDAAIRAAMPELSERAAIFYSPAKQDECIGSGQSKKAGKKHGGKKDDTLTGVSPRTLRRWLTLYDNGGVHALLDRRDKSGNRDRRLSPVALSILSECVRKFLSPEPPSKTQIVYDVRQAFRTTNIAREAEGRPPLTCPSRRTIDLALADLDPFEVMVAQKGVAAARKAFAPVARGVDVQRPLQRVEMDEWQVDLVSLMSCSLGLSYFSDDDIKRLGLTGKKKRFWLTVIMCATTRCILGMRLSRTPTSQSAMQTVEMMLQDKGVWTDAVGALSSWHMQGKPELLVTDCGSAFTSVDFISAMEDLGIRAERAPAGFPEMRARIERLFRTMGTSLMSRLTGRTFSNIIERGDYDSKAKAALTVDDLCEALVRWVVDYYHRKLHKGLGVQAPVDCWNDLTEQYGVQPAPSLRHRRLVFGTKLSRTVRKAGIEVLKVNYHSERLARWMFANPNREVNIRHYREDLGAIEVQMDGEWFEVHAVHDFFRGVPMRIWQASLNMLRSSSQRAYELNEDVMMQAIEHIKSINGRAMARIGLLTEDSSAERIEKEENRLIDCFTLSRENLAADPARANASGSWGYEFKTSEQLASGENENRKIKEVSQKSQLNSSSKGSGSKQSRNGSAPTEWKLEDE
jgi:putative transposase